MVGKCTGVHSLWERKSVAWSQNKSWTIRHKLGDGKFAGVYTLIKRTSMILIYKTRLLSFSKDKPIFSERLVMFKRNKKMPVTKWDWKWIRELVTDQWSLSKLLSVMDNHSHGLCDTLWQQRSTFSNRFILFLMRGIYIYSGSDASVRKLNLVMLFCCAWAILSRLKNTWGNWWLNAANLHPGSFTLLTQTVLIMFYIIHYAFR